MDGQNGKQARRSASRAAKLRKRRMRLNIFIAIAFAVLVIVLVVASPWEAKTRATHIITRDDSGSGETVTAVVSDYTGLKISEVMSSNKGAVVDENGDYSDWIEVWNSSDHDINLSGVGLSDSIDSIRFLFPSVVLPPDGRVLVFCSNTNQSMPGRPFHAKFKLSSVGETVCLFDPSAYMLDSVKVPVMATNESWALVNGKFQAVTYYSPGYENTPEGHQKYRESLMTTEGAVLINEVMADPVSGIRDGDDELSDWVELYNKTDAPVSLENYALSDNETKPLKWRFPAGAVIPARGYYLVFCSGKDKIDQVTGVPHTNFRISAEKQTIILSDSTGRVVDRVMIDNLPENSSFGRDENGAMKIFRMATPGLPNTEAGQNQMDVNLRAMNKTGVILSEVMASNDSIETYPDAGFTDWIEIYNSSGQTVDLSGFGLSNNIGRPRKWQFPNGTVINPGEYKVVLCDKKPDKSTSAQPHAGFKISRQGQETICLSDPDGRVLDVMFLPEMKTNISYGRTPGMTGLFYYDAPTPFKQNIDGFTGFTPSPSFTTEPGMYNTTISTQINVPEGTQVYFTTDCTPPTQSSTPYNGERIEMNFNTVLRARAFSNTGLRPSEIVTGTYLVNAYHTLPVASVVTDPDNLWNKMNGMLVLGDNVVKVAGELPFKNTVYREFGKIPRECHIEIFDKDGTKLISQGAQFALQGDYSLDMPQKSMKFRAKPLYGAKTFQAALFKDRPFTEYKSIVLRNSGNDAMWTRLLDGFESRLLDAYGAKVIHQAWQPVAVYLNGVYWGHMNLRERVDRFFVAQHEGLPLDQANQMDILEASGKVKYGSNKEYKAMISKIKAGNPAKNPSDLQYILDNVDVDNLFEYMALEMFVGNSDIGNTRFYRLKTPGSKWKWIWYDADYGLYNSQFDSPKSYTKTKGMGQQNIDNTIFLKLLSVPEYKDKFLRKFGDIFKTFTTKFMLDVLEPLVEEITPEMQLHWNRWGEENDPFVISEVPTTVDGAYRYWEKRIERLRNTLRKRPTYLWEYIQTGFNLTNDQMLDYFGPKPEMPADAV